MDFAFRFSRWQSWSLHRSCAQVKPVRASALSCAKSFAIAFAIGGAIIPDGIVNHYRAPVLGSLLRCPPACQLHHSSVRDRDLKLLGR